jgi:hypothetical protein
MSKPKPKEPKTVLSAYMTQSVVVEFKDRYKEEMPRRLEALIRADLAQSSVAQIEQEAEEKQAIAAASTAQAQEQLKAAEGLAAHAAKLKQAAVEYRAKEAEAFKVLQPKLAAQKEEAIESIRLLIEKDEFFRAKSVAKHRATGLSTAFSRPILPEELYNEAAARLAQVKQKGDKMYG